jgi:hypothetical protein
MILNAVNEFAEVVDMLPHWSVRRLFELAELVLKEDDSGVALSTVLGLESFPNSCDVFRGSASTVCCSVVFKGIHEVIIRQVVLMIPLVNADFVGVIRIGLSDKNSTVGSWSRSLAEIDDAGDVARFDVAGWIGPLFGNNIPETVLTEEALSFVCSCREILLVERFECDDREFEVEMLWMFVRHFKVEVLKRWVVFDDSLLIPVVPKRHSGLII